MSILKAKYGKAIALLLGIMLVFIITACDCQHEWMEATCKNVKTCCICGEQEGGLGEHKWLEATCSEPKRCFRCDITEGESLPHDFSEATCEEPKTCQNCGITEGDALEHSWLETIDSETQVCEECGIEKKKDLVQDSAEEEQIEVIAEAEEGKIPENSTFEIHYIDVGQADAALVLCDGKAMLIDGGNAEDSSLIYSYLEHQDVSHLEYIVATHGHEDHVGGLSGALNYATVGTAYCSVNNYDSEAFRDFVKYLDKQGKEITIPEVGEHFDLGSASIQIVAVNGDAADHNDASIILRIVYGDTSFLFTGDAEREAEQAALNSGYELESTVLKVGHHGSKNATEYVFLREVAPQYAVISVGEDNTYGHPTEDALSRLRDADVETYRTDLQGTIICVSDGTEVSITVSKNVDADTLAPTATIEQLESIVKKSVDKYNGSSDKKLVGKLVYSVISKTEVQLTYTASNTLSTDEEYLVDEAMDEILDFVLADIGTSNYSMAAEVYAEITINYEIYDGEQTPTTTEPEVEGTDYIGNINTKKFHYSWCSSVNQMNESNKYYYTGTRDEMIAMGYVSCKRCNP